MNDLSSKYYKLTIVFLLIIIFTLFYKNTVLVNHYENEIYEANKHIKQATDLYNQCKRERYLHDSLMLLNPKQFNHWLKKEKKKRQNKNDG